MADIRNAFDLTGRVAVVTGASAGLGQAIAIALAQAGADIVALGRSVPADTGKQVKEAGRKLHALRVDLAARPDPAELVENVLDHFGRLDILVNNAGIIRRSSALEFSEEDWDEVLDVNLRSVFFLSQAAARAMMHGKRGKIINIASMLSFQGGIRVASYTASKSGLLGLTRLLANEWAAQGINVNALAPGYFETGNTAALRADAARNEEILRRIPAGRWGNPADLAGAAVFLASSASDYVHGAVLPVDGGWLAR
jgi:2-dehydro-3-deoxy-D-gluconate 5-dehydrogenase